MKKVVVVTGGSEGIGRACVELFHKNDYEVINLDIKKPESGLGLFIQTDVSKVSEIKKAFQKISEQYSAIDVLVSNAGMHVSATVEATDEALFDQVISTNLKSAFFVVQSAIPLMRNKGKRAKNGGRIVMMGSEQTFVGKPHSAAYGLTKAAIAQLTKSIALDYMKEGIVANCVCPGTIETPLYWKAIQSYCDRSGRDLDEVHKEEGAMQPIGRIGQPEEIASLIYYLANDAGSFIQGASFTIDGGYTIQ